MPRWAPLALIMSLSPRMISSDSSTISLWSQVRNGSHSTPLRITVSTFTSPSRYFTWVGKVAPPIPTRPAWSISSTISSRENPSGAPWGLGRGGAGVSSPSFSKTTVRDLFPLGKEIVVNSFTTPDTLACKGTLILPPASAIFSPKSTCCPRSTMGWDGAPRCCPKGR